MIIDIALIFAVALVGLGGWVIFRYLIKGRTAAENPDRRQTAPLRLIIPGVGLLLIILIGINLEFCSEQRNRMDANTTRDNSLDNVGKDENEAASGEGNEQDNQDEDRNPSEPNR